MPVGLPLTGSGETTATVATELISTQHYQYFKLISGVAASTQHASVLATTPGSGDGGLVTRPIGSTAFNQAVVGSVSITSEGSTRVIGLVDGIPMTPTLSTANTSVDASLLASNAARRSAMIQNGATAVALLVRLSTAAVSSGSPYNFQVPANGFVVIGGQLGNIPLYTGAIRGKLNSTSVAGPCFITEFT